MSNFIIPEERLNPRASYKLDTDALRGFKLASTNFQTRLALEYLSHILTILDEKLTELSSTQEPAPTLTQGQKIKSATTSTKVTPAAKTAKKAEETAPVDTDGES